jgi:hypothetical protein
MTRGYLVKGGISEAAFSTRVEDLLDLYKWRWCHFKTSKEQSGRWSTAMRGHKGFPDYVAVRVETSGCRVLFIELKSEKGIVSKEQRIWIDILQASQNEVYVWRPSDFDNIAKVLE